MVYRRFGVKSQTKQKVIKGQTVGIETLESIGKSMGITRERVRQIEEGALRKTKQALTPLLAA